MKVDEIRKINSKLSSGAEAKVGDTILLPAGKLSARDKDIIDGITKINQPRIYPTRKGESIMDIIEPRGIRFEDVKKLNPGVNLGTFTKGDKQAAAGQVHGSGEGDAAGVRHPPARERQPAAVPLHQKRALPAGGRGGLGAVRLLRRGVQEVPEVRDQALGERSSAHQRRLRLERRTSVLATQLCTSRERLGRGFVAPVAPSTQLCRRRGHETRRGAPRGSPQPKPPPSVIRVVND